MKFAGEDGVAAYGVIMYVNFIFIAMFLGYSIGIAPIISFHYGAGNHDELKSLLKKSLFLIGGFSVILTLAAEGLAGPLSKIFVGYDKNLYEMTCLGFRLFSLSFLFNGWNIFGSAFFTALNNGMVSAFISFLRAFVLQIVMVLLLPVFWGINGIWFSANGSRAAGIGYYSIFFDHKKKRISLCLKLLP